MSPQQQDWDALAKYVRSRREAMRLPIDLSRRGGPAEMTVRRIESGETAPIRSRTKTLLEQVLEMKPGLVDKILDGAATGDELAERWVIADSEGKTRVKADADGRLSGRVVSTTQAGIEATAHANLGGLAAHAGGTSHDADTASLAHAAHDVGQALVSNLVFVPRTPRVQRAVELMQEAFSLLLAEQGDPGGQP